MLSVMYLWHVTWHTHTHTHTWCTSGMAEVNDARSWVLTHDIQTTKSCCKTRHLLTAGHIDPWQIAVSILHTHAWMWRQTHHTDRQQQYLRTTSLMTKLGQLCILSRHFTGMEQSYFADSWRHSCTNLASLKNRVNFTLCLAHPSCVHHRYCIRRHSCISVMVKHHSINKFFTHRILCKCGISYCKAVRPSNAWIVTKRRKLLPTFLYRMKGQCI